jgi:hypothetical protein
LFGWARPIILHSKEKAVGIAYGNINNKNDLQSICWKAAGWWPRAETLFN